MANKKIIELDAASQVNSDAVFPLSQLVNSNQKTLKATIAQIQSAVLAPVSGLVTLGESSGSITSFSTDIADKLFSCYVNVTAVQAGSGTPAPDNVRAISGWDNCRLQADGKNMFDLSLIGTYDFTLVGDYYRTTKPFLKAGTYKWTGVSFTASIQGLSVRLYGSTTMQMVANGSIVSTGSITSTTDIYLEINYTKNGFINAVSDFKGQIESGNQATTYQAYNGTTHNIPFNTTVYGGVLDVLSGVLTVTHGYVDLGSLTWTDVDSNSLHNSNVISDLMGGGYDADLSSFMCEMFTPKSIVSGWNGMSNGEYGIANISGMVFRVKWSNIASGTDFKTFVNGKKMVYKLATPTVIQLTPTEVKTILGQNNIFGDCGDIDLKYLETIGNRL